MLSSRSKNIFPIWTLGARMEIIVCASPPPVALMMVSLNIYLPGKYKHDVGASRARESEGYVSVIATANT